MSMRTNGEAEPCLKRTIFTSVAECKSMLTNVFNGEQPGDKWKGHPFTNRVRTLGRYMRWLACSVLPNVYQERMENGDCSWPQASTLYYLWTSLEDYILGKIVDFLTESPVQHLSLHYDGVRVQFNEGVPDVEELCKDIGLFVAQETGFTIHLREKIHNPLFPMIDSVSKHRSSSSEALPQILAMDGQCIPAALHMLGRLPTDVLKALQRLDTSVANRCYRDVLTHAKVGVSGISLGIVMDSDVDCLIHAENNGRPHCIAARRIGDDVTLWHAGVEHTMSCAKTVHNVCIL